MIEPPDRQYYDCHPFEFLDTEVTIIGQKRLLHVLGVFETAEDFLFFGLSYRRPWDDDEVTDVRFDVVSYWDCDFAGTWSIFWEPMYSEREVLC